MFKYERDLKLITILIDYEIERLSAEIKIDITSEVYKALDDIDTIGVN